MARRLPPLGLLRAFEAAARHMSFTKATEELFVTQAAISHQVKALEDWLQTPLFRRMNRTLELTEAGRMLLPAARDAFDGISQTLSRMRRLDEAGTLTVSTLSSFAAKWLLPRLPRFQSGHPDIDERLSTSRALVDFTRDDIDIAIRFGLGSWPSVVAERLFGEDIFPVCSPALIGEAGKLSDPNQLATFTLLHDNYQIQWPMWLNAAGATAVDPARGPRFNDSELVIQAAIAGHGVALARSVLVADDLAAGRLVRPFKQSLPVDFAYWVVAPAHHLERPKIRAFRDWAVAEARTGQPVE